MRKLTIIIVVMLATIAGMTARAATAANFNPPCQFNDGFYKYAGEEHKEFSLPTWSLVQMNQTVQWWGFTDQNWHTSLWLGIANFYNGGTAWLQAGTTAGYDDWGWPLTTNYPYGDYNDNFHPNGGNGAPTYTPNGVFVNTRYSESVVSGFVSESVIGPIGTGNGLTLAVRNDGGGYFSMVDQDNHTLGVANHVFIGTSTGVGAGHGFVTESVIEDASTHLGGSYCAWDSANNDHLNATAANTSFWGVKLGCFQNVENYLDPNCHGGAGVYSAPEDEAEYYANRNGTLLSQFSMFVGEGINGFGPAAVQPNGSSVSALSPSSMPLAKPVPLNGAAHLPREFPRP